MFTKNKNAIKSENSLEIPSPDIVLISKVKVIKLKMSFTF